MWQTMNTPSVHLIEYQQGVANTPWPHFGSEIASVNKENVYVCGIVQLKQGLKADFGPLCGSV